MHSQSIKLSSLIVGILAASSAMGGSLRYDLTDLLGEYRFENTAEISVQRTVNVDTPLTYYSASSARVVVEGSVTPGVGRGDGILREALQFELLPTVSAQPSFTRSVIAGLRSPLGAFRLDTIYFDPFVPETTPLPTPGGYPPLSFSITMSIGLNDFLTQFPPVLQRPPDFLFVRQGTIVEVPIVAHITDAYIVFEGRGVVPEPRTVSLIALSAIPALSRLRLRKQPMPSK